MVKGVVEIMHRQANLPQVVCATRSVGRLAGTLHRRQQQSDEDGNDRDDHQQLDQGKSSSFLDSHFHLRFS